VGRWVPIPLQSRSDPQLRIAAISIRDIDQAGDPTNEGVLVTCQESIRIGDLPKHLDNANAFSFAEIIDHDLGEMKQVYRLKRPFVCCLNETSDLALI
jgi:hypothetical protein